MRRNAIAWTVLFAALWAAGPAAAAPENRVPECGVASTYAVLKLLGRPAPLAEVEGRFKQLCPGSNPDTLSMSELRTVLNSYSVHTLPVQVDVRDLKGLPYPSILYLRPDRIQGNRTGIGHYLVLHSVSDTAAEVIDLSMQGGFSRRSVPLGDLTKVWDGEMLAVSLTPFKAAGLPPWLVAANLLLLFGAFAYVAWSERELLRQTSLRLTTRKAPRNAAVALLLCALAAPAGCARREVGPPADAGDSPLTIDVPEKNLALPRGLMPEAEETFTLRTWDKGEVEITDVASSCGCVSILPNLVGSKLQPDTKATITVRMRMNPGEPARTVIVRFSTEPAGRKPAVITINGTSASLPSVPVLVNLDAPLGSKPAVDVKVTYFRQRNDQKLALDTSRSSLYPFRLEKSETRSELQVLTSKQVDPFMMDTLDLKLVLEHPPGLGTRQSKLRLAWEGDIPESEVPVRIQVQHPLSPALSELFCGEMTAGQTVTRSVPLIGRGPDRPRIRSVKAMDPLVAPRVNDAGDSLEVNVTAPRQAGRFETVVVLAYDPPTVPESRLRVAGLVPGGK